MLAWSPLARRLQLHSLRPRIATVLRCYHDHSRFTGSRPSIAQLLHSKKRLLVNINGRIVTIRKQKRIAFAAVGDGSTSKTIQVVLSPEQAAGLTTGSAVSMFGIWQRSEGAGQAYELNVKESSRGKEIPPIESTCDVQKTDLLTERPYGPVDSATEIDKYIAAGAYLNKIELLGPNDSESNPLQPKWQTPEYLRTIPHLRVRTDQNAFLLRLRSRVISSLTSHFDREGFIQVHTPIITSSDCEGAGEVFTVMPATSVAPSAAERTEKTEIATESQQTQQKAQHFFREPKYLTVSAQLHLEAIAHSMNRVWTLSPTFRAERSDTPRHLSEFYMLEAELCFESAEQTMDRITWMLGDVARDLLCNFYPEDIKPEDRERWHGSKKDQQATRGDDTWMESELNDLANEARHGIEWPSVKARETVLLRLQGLQMRWPRITYAKAILILQEAVATGKASFAVQPTYEGGLDAEHERYLTQHFNASHYSEADLRDMNIQEPLDVPTPRPPTPIFVTNYPAHHKPFYMAPTPPGDPAYDDNNPTVSNFDLLVPGQLELAGGSAREHRLEELQAAMKARGLTPGSANLAWYEDLRRYGSAPHAGFGMGFDRLLGYLSGVDNVRDVVPWPRWAGRCDG